MENETISTTVMNRRMREFYAIVNEYAPMVELDFARESARIGEISMPISEYLELWQGYRDMQITAYDVRKKLSGLYNKNRNNTTIDDFME